MPRAKKAAVTKIDNDTKKIADALVELCKEKGLPVDIVKDAIGEALKNAYIKFSGDYPDTPINVDIDLQTGAIKMAIVKNVVEEIQDDVFETDPEEAFEATGVQYKVGDVMELPIDYTQFRRAIAVHVKSVFKQKLREAEKKQISAQYQDKVGEIMNGIVDVVEADHCIIRINDRYNAYLSKRNMLPGDSFRIGEAVKVFIANVDNSSAGTPITVSRTDAKFVTCLMKQDISEIGEGKVEIKNVARNAGFRTKVAVYSNDPEIDPSGACIGTHGSRINRVVSQIHNEKIDVVNYSDNPLLFVADALKPATVIGVMMVDEEAKACRAIVSDDQYSLAIGKEAQNVNLAVKLTGWKIDIKSETEAMTNGYEYEKVADLKIMEEAKAKAVRTSVIRPEVKAEEVPEVKTSVTDVIEEEPVKEPVFETVTETKTEEIKPAEPKVTEVEETPVVKKTKNTYNSFNDLENALSGSDTSSSKEQKPFKKKYTKKTDKIEEEEEDTTPAIKVTPKVATPIYTEEELAALDEEEAAEENKYDDIDEEDIDDSYDDYYEDK